MEMPRLLTHTCIIRRGEWGLKLLLSNSARPHAYPFNLRFAAKGIYIDKVGATAANHEQQQQAKTFPRLFTSRSSDVDDSFHPRNILIQGKHQTRKQEHKQTKREKGEIRNHTLDRTLLGLLSLSRSSSKIDRADDRVQFLSKYT